MKRILLLMSIFVSIGSFGQQVKKHTPITQTAEQYAEQQTQWIEGKNPLSVKKHKKVYDANLECFSKLIALRNRVNQNVTPEENMAILKVRDEKLKTIMTPEQFVKFENTKPYAK